MDKNIVLAIILSVGVIFAWEGIIMRPYRIKNLPIPVASQNKTEAITPKSSPEETEISPAKITPEELFMVKTANSEVVIGSGGAYIKHWYLREKNKLIELVLYPDALPLATFPEVEFTLAREEPGELVLTGTTGDASHEGIKITKRFLLSEKGYLHGVELILTNQGNSKFQHKMPLQLGPGLGTDAQNAKDNARATRLLAFNQSLLKTLRPGHNWSGEWTWMGIDNTYFLMALVNRTKQAGTINTVKSNGTAVIETSLDITLEPGETKTFKYQIYAGPKLYSELKKHELGLEKSIDFGTFAPFSQAALFCLKAFYKLTKNYGWAIIMLTVLVQILTLPLTLKSFKHSLKMKALQPQVRRLQEQFRHDPKRLNVEMLNLYKRHGMKFMGMEGCFPMLLQLPVFWALFTVLRNTYELRGAPWLGWVRDLSLHDPFYVLPILMGLGMLLQQKMSSVTSDPNQKMMTYLMPVIFTFFFLNMPAGLVLYWLTSSLLSVSVQFAMMRRSSETQSS